MNGKRRTYYLMRRGKTFRTAEAADVRRTNSLVAALLMLPDGWRFVSAEEYAATALANYERAWKREYPAAAPAAHDQEVEQ